MQRASLIREPVTIALQNLWAHKLRSFLTLLGVIIAVTALIGVMAAVNGLNRYVADKVANFGVNVFYVSRFGIITSAKEYLDARRHNRMLTMDDYDYLHDHLTLASMVGAQDWRNLSVKGGDQSLDSVFIRGATPNMIDISTDRVASGRFFSESEYEHRSNVAFLGTDVAERCFPNADPLGQTITISGVTFQVVGVAEKQGSAFGQSQDNFIYIPLTTLVKSWGQDAPGNQGMWVAVKTASTAEMGAAKDQARALMRARRHESYDEPDRFGIISSDSVMGLWNQIFGGLANASIGIVSVFLVIGGVVIMNIMLASVTERTHEIGLRKSLGARRADILMQFVVEAAVMAAVGGLVGVGVAGVVTTLVSRLTSMPMKMPMTAVAVSIGVSTAVGLFFGLWPAMKASRLDPVVALRTE